jgi:hypothetical protein
VNPIVMRWHCAWATMLCWTESPAHWSMRGRVIKCTLSLGYGLRAVYLGAHMLRSLVICCPELYRTCCFRAAALCCTCDVQHCVPHILFFWVRDQSQLHVFLALCSLHAVATLTWPPFQLDHAGTAVPCGTRCLLQCHCAQCAPCT